MGIFDSLKNWTTSGRSADSEHWNTPGTKEDIDAIFESGTHVIYKHSYSCGICAYTQGNIEKKIDDIAQSARLHFVDVKASRPISDYIAEMGGVAHQSPQVLVIRNGDVIHDASHGSVKAETIQAALGQV